MNTHPPGILSCRSVPGSDCNPSRDSAAVYRDRPRPRFRLHDAREYPQGFHFVHCMLRRSICTRCTWSCRSESDIVPQGLAVVAVGDWTPHRTTKPPAPRPFPPPWSDRRPHRLPVPVRVGVAPLIAPLMRRFSAIAKRCDCGTAGFSHTATASKRKETATICFLFLGD